MANNNFNRGVLFVNRNKRKQSDPDYSGTINIGGVDYWANGWINTARQGVRGGEQFISFTIGNPKPANQGQQGYQQSTQQGYQQPVQQQPPIHQQPPPHQNPPQPMQQHPPMHQQPPIQQSPPQEWEYNQPPTPNGPPPWQGV